MIRRGNADSSIPNQFVHLMKEVIIENFKKIQQKDLEEKAG